MISSKDAISRIERKYKALYDSSPDLYRTTSPEGIILECNNAYATNLGYTKQEIVGKSVFEHTSETSIFSLMESMESWKKNGHVTNVEIWLKRKDGNTFPTLLSSTTIFNENGSPSNSTILKDVTEIINARNKIHDREKIIEKQLEQLKQVETQKDEFMCMITHELKTPLFPIQAHCELLSDHILDDNLNEDQKESIKEIYNNSKKLEKLIGDVLEAQKIEMGRLSIRKDYFQATSLINDLEKSFKHVLNEQNIKFTLSNHANMMIYSDRERLMQVFGNIIINAIDFVPEGEGRIEIGTKENGDEIIFYVKDNGIGIPIEKQSLLFKKFYQMDTSVSRKHEGNGLGLIICKGIVESLSGKIWVESDPGNGTTFYFSVPKMKEDILKLNNQII
jgi:PAS domain S-box-containing protein